MHEYRFVEAPRPSLSNQYQAQTVRKQKKGFSSPLILDLVLFSLWRCGTARLIVQNLPELPDSPGKNSTEDWADPVNPEIRWEGSVRHGGHSCTQGSGRVQTSTGRVDANQVTNEQRDTDGSRGPGGEE